MRFCGAKLNIKTRERARNNGKFSLFLHVVVKGLIGTKPDDPSQSDYLEERVVKPRFACVYNDLWFEKDTLETWSHLP